MALDGILSAIDEAAQAAGQKNFNHFLRLMANGRSRGASSGAIAARRIACVLVEFVPALDGQAVEGLKQFLDLAKYAPESAQGLVENH